MIFLLRIYVSRWPCPASLFKHEVCRVPLTAFCPHTVEKPVDLQHRTVVAPQWLTALFVPSQFVQDSTFTLHKQFRHHFCDAARARETKFFHQEAIADARRESEVIKDVDGHIRESMVVRLSQMPKSG